MALIHHWKFNNSLQDAVGDIHLTNVSGTSLYTVNKDGLADKAADFDSTWYAYSDSQSTGLEEYETLTYSFWIYTNITTTSYTYLYSGRSPVGFQEGNIGFNFNLNLLRFQYKADSIRYFYDAYNVFSLNQWSHVIVKFDFVNKVLKVFENGVLKYIDSSISGTSLTLTNSEMVLGAGDTLGSYSMKNKVDEFKIFNHILSDGEVVNVNQTASLDSEVWQLYISGVNNIPAYTLNPATDITGTSARLTWNES